MPLRDHFHAPLSELRHWESFHSAWATGIMRTLNRRVLPSGCFAEAQISIGGRVEIDVATFAQNEVNVARLENGEGGVAVEPWAPPRTELIMPTVFPDEIEVRIYRTSGGATLVAAIELVSPGNKDRADARRAFAAKCAVYLQQGIGLVVIDIETERHANLHNELIHLLEQPARFVLPEAARLYVVAYRPSRTTTGDQVEMWPTPLALGRPLPTVPLALREVVTLPLDLEGTYDITCQDCLL